MLFSCGLSTVIKLNGLRINNRPQNCVFNLFTQDNFYPRIERLPMGCLQRGVSSVEYILVSKANKPWERGVSPGNEDASLFTHVPNPCKQRDLIP